MEKDQNEYYKIIDLRFYGILNNCSKVKEKNNLIKIFFTSTTINFTRNSQIIIQCD